MSLKTISEKFEDFASERTSDRRWVSVRGKTPVRPGTTEPVEWRKIENRWTWEQIQKIPGDCGIILDKTGLTCIDFDKCLSDDGNILSDRIADIVRNLDTWTEISSSGRGLHCWIITDANTKNQKPGTGFEVISDGHVKVTGNSHPMYADRPIQMVNGERLSKILRLNGSGPAGQHKPAVPITREPIREGNRNTCLFRLASSLRAKGLSEPAILAALDVENRELCNPPLPDSEVSRIASSAGNYAPGLVVPTLAQRESDVHKYPDSFYHWVYKKKGDSWEYVISGLEHPAVITYLRDRFSTVSFSDTLFIYDNGIYRKNAHDIESVLTDMIHDRGLTISETKEHREFRAALLGMNRFLEYPFNQHTDALPLKNGILKLNLSESKAELIPFSPDYKFTFKIPVVYNTSLTGDVFHNEVISQYLEKDNTDVLYQIPATALLQALGKSPYKKSYIIQGAADGGKTTYLSYLHQLLGDENIGHASLQQIGIDNFVNADLESRLLNTFDDLPDIPLQNIGMFKSLTGGYDHKINQKQQPRYNGKIFCVHVFTCNQPPEVPEKILFDAAFWGRWEYLHFDNIFALDTDFKNRYFTPENISGSFNRVLKILFKIAKDGLVVNGTPSEVKDVWQTASDPFAMFIRDNMHSTTDEHVFDKEHLLESVRDYCRETEINERKTPSTQKALSTMVFKNGFKDALRGTKSNRVKVYVSHRAWNPNSKYREGNK